MQTTKRREIMSGNPFPKILNGNKNQTSISDDTRLSDIKPADFIDFVDFVDFMDSVD